MHYYQKLQMGRIEKFKTTLKLRGCAESTLNESTNESTKKASKKSIKNSRLVVTFRASTR